MFNSENFFTSGWNFDKAHLDLKSKFQMINVALLLSSIGLLFGISVNVYKEAYGIIPLEAFLLLMNTLFFIALRKRKESFAKLSFLMSIQFSFFFLYLYATYPPEAMKFIWLFTYPVLLLYFQEKKYVKYWMIFMISMILIGPLQNVIPVQFTSFQSLYLSFVFIIVYVIITFYQKKMEEANRLIFKQQEQLLDQVNELTHKDKMLNMQSKQAVMGEMISMIAHQWRQPLSTVTLSISDLQVKRMLGTGIDEKLMDDTLQSISDTVVYLSETIDDFQTYFQPNREIDKIGLDNLVQKALNFVKPRLKGSNISIELESIDVEIETYINELIQVILNILNNALDELLKLEREDLKIKIELREKEEFVELSIVDNATGIKHGELEKIFEPYYSTKGKNGTGLGLYMSQMIMQKQFNSFIKVQSSSKGSCFTLEIPKKLQ